MSTTSPDLILLKGAPGVGKSTTARILAQHYPFGVRVEVDALRQMVISVDWTNQAEHKNLLMLSAQLAAGFLRSGFSPVILIDTFSGDKVEGFLAAFRAACPESRVFVAVLHADGEVLRDRVLRREEGGFRDLQVSSRLNNEVVRDVRSYERLFDTTNLTPTEVARAVIDAL